MKRERLASVWQIAIKLFVESAGELTSPKTSSYELEKEIIKERSEELAKRCFWLALYGVAEIDKQFNEMHKRVKK